MIRFCPPYEQYSLLIKSVEMAYLWIVVFFAKANEFCGLAIYQTRWMFEPFDLRWWFEKAITSPFSVRQASLTVPVILLQFKEGFVNWSSIKIEPDWAYLAIKVKSLK